MDPVAPIRANKIAEQMGVHSLYWILPFACPRFSGGFCGALFDLGFGESKYSTAPEGTNYDLGSGPLGDR